MVTRAIDVVRVVAPRARPEYLRAFERIDDELKTAGIDTPLRLAHWLAQLMHESGGLTVTFENMNYRAKRIMEVFGVGRHTARVTWAEANRIAGNPRALAERVYGLGNPRKAQELGNTRPGDGYRFRGGGPMQITGGDSYRRYGEMCGVDFYAHPDLIVSEAYCLLPPIQYWTVNNINIHADANNIGKVTRTINGGTNGLKDRERWFARIYPLCAGNDSQAWEASSYSEETLWVQQSLNDLGCEPALDEDGKLGPKTKKAIKWFQKKAKLDPDVDGADGDAGPITRAAITSALRAIRADDKIPNVVETTEGKVSLGTGITGTVQAVSEASSTYAELKANLANAGIGDTIAYVINKPAVLVAIVLLGVAAYFYFKHRQRAS